MDGLILRLFILHLDWALVFALALGCGGAVDLCLLLGGLVITDIRPIVVRLAAIRLEVVAGFPLEKLVLQVELRYTSRWTYPSPIPPPRLRLPAPPLVPVAFFGVAFWVVPFAPFLRGVPPLAEGTEKWVAVPDALAIARILKMRSEIARGVGRSRPAAGAVLLA